MPQALETYGIKRIQEDDDLKTEIPAVLGKVCDYFS